MPLAMCLGPEALIFPLLLLLLLAAGGATLFVFAFVALVRWADARQKRMAAEDSLEPPLVANAGSRLNL